MSLMKKRKCLHHEPLPQNCYSESDILVEDQLLQSLVWTSNHLLEESRILYWSETNTQRWADVTDYLHCQHPHSNSQYTTATTGDYEELHKLHNSLSITPLLYTRMNHDSSILFFNMIHLFQIIHILQQLFE